MFEYTDPLHPNAVTATGQNEGSVVFTVQYRDTAVIKHGEGSCFWLS